MEGGAMRNIEMKFITTNNPVSDADKLLMDFAELDRMMFRRVLEAEAERLYKKIYNDKSAE